MATYNDKTMTGKEWADLLSSGYKNLALHADLINDLNVFPVPGPAIINNGPSVVVMASF